MSDKESIVEAVKMIKRRNKLVKKSLAGIDRVFEYDTKEPKGLTRIEEGLSSFPLAEKKEEEKPVEEEKEKEEKEKKPQTIEEVRAMFEKKPTKYKIKRNTMAMFL